MNATFFRLSAAFALVLSLASNVLALDATQAVRRDVTPKSSVPTGTVATWPMDAAVPPGWLACNGQAVPSSYPELRTLMASVPNYNNKQFLRGATSGAGSSVADSTRSHTHGQPSHSHGFALEVANKRVSGTASGQKYQDMKSGYYPYGSGGVQGSTEFRQHVSNIFGSLGSSTLYMSPSAEDAIPYQWIIDGGADYTSDSSLKNTYLDNGTVSGVIQQSGGDETYASGGSETAPMHTLVKYIIKAD